MLRENPFKKRLEKVSVILSVLERKPLEAKEISEETTIPLATLYRNLKELKDYGFIEKHGKLFQNVLKYMLFNGVDQWSIISPVEIF